MIRPVPHQERGAALLAVLLLVAVMAALSVVAIDRLRIATRLSGNGTALDQARAYASGAETLALARVTEFARRSPDAMTLAGGWNGRRLLLPVPHGLATVTVSDGGNCFNLNSVAQGNILVGLTARPAGIAQFTALMQLLGIDQRPAHHIAASLADWIDSDTVPIPDGAEDDRYRNGPDTYRTANTLLAERSELRAVTGVTPAIYATLKPWICALPVTDLSPLNVNTLAPEQAPLVAMLLPDRLDLSAARRIIASRPLAGFESIAAFWKLPALAALTPSGEVQAQPQLRTRWFALDLDVEQGGAQLTETALIDGGLRPARLVVRRWGNDE